MRKQHILVSCNIKYLPPYILVTLPYKYKCYIFCRIPPYMYITTSYDLCNICICSPKKFKLILLLRTHIYLYVL